MKPDSRPAAAEAAKTAKAAYIKHRVQCEEALVAIAFTDPRAAIDKVASIVRPSDFEDADLGEVYSVLQDLHVSGFRLEVEAVCGELAKRGVVARIGREAAKRILNADCSSDNSRYYAEEVARLADHRRIVREARRVLTSEHDLRADPSELREQFKVGSRLDRHTAEAVSIGQSVSEMLEFHRAARASGATPGIPTGFPSIDRATSGLHRGQLWLLGARSNTGKTALAMSIAANLSSGRASSGRNRVLMFSLEMTRSELAERCCADELGINYSRFCHADLTGAHLDKIERHAPEFARWPFAVLDSPGQTTADIAAKAKLYAPAGGLDLIVVDTLQSVRPANPRIDRRLQLQAIAVELKEAARRLNCCIILCAQLGAAAEGKEPDLTHLSEAKQIVEPCDAVLLMHRPDRKAESMLIKVEKLRRGARKPLYINFDGKFQRFTDPVGEREQAAPAARSTTQGAWVS